MSDSSPTNTIKTTCCVVGGGPAGMVLAYLLARHGVEVTLLESHGDFDRDFRGETFHASSMDLMDEVGLGEKVDAIIHSKIKNLEFLIPGDKPAELASFEGLNIKHPYVAIIPQVEFLDLLAGEAKGFGGFKLLMKHTASGLIEEDGKVVGVTYRHGQEHGEIRADLVVAADGRGSRLRKEGGFDLVPGAPAMDIVWFKLKKAPGETMVGLNIVVGSGNMLIIIDRGDEWQCGLVILKGGLKELRDAGLEAFHKTVDDLAPESFKGLVAKDIDEWKKTSVLAVQVGRVKTWHKPGLLLIGDAAHIMSPIGGVGINYAIQDAVATFNHLAEPLKQGKLEEKHLAAVQKRREWPVEVIQKMQATMQNQIVEQALKSDEPFHMPTALNVIAKLPGLDKLPALMMAYGVRHDSKPDPQPV